MSNIFETESTSLQHHGILGQKWGVRRFENKNGTLTPAGRKRYDTDENGDYKKVSKSPAPKSSSSEGEPKKKGLSDKQKKMIIAGAAIAGTALAAYGGYKLYQHVENTKKEAQAHIIQKGNEATMKALQSEHAKEMSAIRDYVEAKNSSDGHHTNNGLLVNPEAYKNHWTGVRQKNKAEINQRNAEVRENAKKIGSSYKASKAYLNYEKITEKDGRERDLIDIQNATKSIARLNTQAQKSSAKATSKLASEASALARSVTAEGPKSFSKSAQNGQTKPQMTQQKLKAVQESQPKIDRATVSHTPIDRVQVDRATVNRIKVDRTPINMDSFNKAAQANDDLVNSLLKKNAKNLGL